jgi:hypothetical protein
VPKSGSGVLLVVAVRGGAAGLNRTTPLTFEAVVLANSRAQEIPFGAENGTVRVVEVVAGSGPTSTPLPTQPAGTPLPTRTPLSTSAAATVTPRPPTATPQPTATPAATAAATRPAPAATAGPTRPQPATAPDGGDALPTAAAAEVTATPLPTAANQAVDDPTPTPPEAVAAANTGPPDDAQPTPGALSVVGAGGADAAVGATTGTNSNPARSSTWPLIMTIAGGLLIMGGGAFVLGRRSTAMASKEAQHDS